MDLDRAPIWLKALAASLWVAFVLAPPFVWLANHFGEAAIWAAAPALALAYTVFHARLADEAIPDAEYYRRKANRRCAAD
jgi:hypothetical protein